MKKLFGPQSAFPILIKIWALPGRCGKLERAEDKGPFIVFRPSMFIFSFFMGYLISSFMARL